MGLFDKVSTDGTGTTGTFIQSVVAFAKLDLNYAFKNAGAAVVSIVTNAIALFRDVFGQKDCNDQDAVLVERFTEQIPGMFLMLSELGYYDESIRDWLKSDPNAIYDAMGFGRPKGAHPCNELLYPARLLFTILFGVRMTNSNYLDALAKDVDSYYAAGQNTWDIPRNAVERAVFLRKTFFSPSTENKELWDLNKFQEYPLVAPIPDPIQPGVLYTGEFLGVQVVNGMAVGDPIPDIGINTGTNTETNSSLNDTRIQKLISYAKAHPMQVVAAAAAIAFAYYEIESDD